MALNSGAHEPLTFFRLALANSIRCGEVFHPIEAWSESEWMVAVAGEVGEAANLIKKRNRPEPIPVDDVVDELADAVIYIDLLCTRMGASLEDGIRRKFESVSVKRRSTVHLG